MTAAIRVKMPSADQLRVAVKRRAGRLKSEMELEAGVAAVRRV
jgi:hypothetical protein